MTLGYDNLYDFQKADVDKFRGVKSRLVGGDIGTGKTPTCIVLDVLDRSDHREKYPDAILKTLIVTLSGGPMVDHWDRHCMEWTEEDVYVLDPKDRAPFIKACLDPWRGGYFICHWDALRTKDMAAIRKVKWFDVIGDEIQKIKSHKSQTNRAFKKLGTLYKTGASGTAADDKPLDLQQCIGPWMHPGDRRFSSYWRLYEQIYEWEFAVDKQTGERKGYREISGLNQEGVAKLRRDMAPFYQHHSKTEVLKDLPPIYYSRYHVELTPQQRKAYREMEKTMIAWVERMEEEGKEQDPLIVQYAHVQFMRLQQFALGYMRYDGTKPKWNPKLKVYEDKEVWTMIEPSPKLDMVDNLIEELGAEPLVVFSHSKQVIRLLHERMRSYGISYGIIAGPADWNTFDRTQVVRDFQAGKLQVLGGTIKAGGTGIDLTRSSTMAFLSREWGAAANKQAEGREWRNGQTNAVHVIDILARNTVDHGALLKVDLKWSWIREVLGLAY